MVEREDLMELLAVGFSRFMYDNFNSCDSLLFTRTGTAIETRKLMELKLSSGIQVSSAIKMRYNYNIFSILYGSAYFRLQFSDTENIKAFFGFKETENDPVFGSVGSMVEYHAGVFIEPDILTPALGTKVYWSTGDGVTQQKVEILGIDITRDMIYKIQGQRLSTMPLPQVVPYFDTFHYTTPDRVWSLKQDNSSVLPFDTSYYCVFYLQNLSAEEKNVRIKSFAYGEEYAD